MQKYTLYPFLFICICLHLCVGVCVGSKTDVACNLKLPFAFYGVSRSFHSYFFFFFASLSVFNFYSSHMHTIVVVIALANTATITAPHHRSVAPLLFVHIHRSPTQTLAVACWHTMLWSVAQMASGTLLWLVGGWIVGPLVCGGHIYLLISFPISIFSINVKTQVNRNETSKSNCRCVRARVYVCVDVCASVWY